MRELKKMRNASAFVFFGSLAATGEPVAALGGCGDAGTYHYAEPGYPISEETSGECVAAAEATVGSQSSGCNDECQTNCSTAFLDFFHYPYGEPGMDCDYNWGTEQNPEYRTHLYCACS